MNSKQNATHVQIALDGPSASGKSTVGAMLAQKLGYKFLDTGMMYRAVTRIAIKNRISTKDGNALSNIAANTTFSVCQDQKHNWRLFADGKDITDHLYSDEVNFNVSTVSATPDVRRALVQQQRNIANSQPTVMAGRDIGTVVLAQSPIKIYLTADHKTRADRRTSDPDGNADQKSYRQVLNSIKRRDEIDSNRHHSPLRPADDAIIIATDNLTANQVVGKILNIISAHHEQAATPTISGGQAA